MKKVASSSPRLTPNQVSLVKLGKALFDAHLRVAKLDGYIDRVREVERRVEVKPDREFVPDAIAKLGRLIADSPEAQASQILDAIQPELLDKILGKPDEPRNSMND